MERPLNIPERPINLEGIQIYLLEDGSTIDEVHEKGITIGREGSPKLVITSEKSESLLDDAPDTGEKEQEQQAGEENRVVR